MPRVTASRHLASLLLDVRVASSKMPLACLCVSRHQESRIKNNHALALMDLDKEFRLDKTRNEFFLFHGVKDDDTAQKIFNKGIDPRTGNQFGCMLCVGSGLEHSVWFAAWRRLTELCRFPCPWVAVGWAPTLQTLPRRPIVVRPSGG